MERNIPSCQLQNGYLQPGLLSWTPHSQSCRLLDICTSTYNRQLNLYRSKTKFCVVPSDLYTPLGAPLIGVVHFFLLSISIIFNTQSECFLFSGFPTFRYIYIVVLQYDLIIPISEISAGLFLVSVLLLSLAVSWCAWTYLYTTHYSSSKLHTKADQLGIMKRWLISSL